MKTRFDSQRGTVVLVSLCFVAVLGIALTSYITLSTRLLYLSNRNYQSTRALQLAEMGVEEALWALNQATWPSGWTINGTTATKIFTPANLGYEGSVAGEVAIQIQNYNGSGSKTVNAEGHVAYADGTIVRKQLMVTTTPAPMFVNAISATRSGVVDTGWSNPNIDSYNSTTGSYGSSTPRSSAVLAGATVNLWTAHVNGYCATTNDTAPNNIMPSYGARLRARGSSLQVDSSRESTSAYIPQFDVSTVSGAGDSTTLAPYGWTPSTNSGAWTVTLGTAGATTPSVYYGSDLIMGAYTSGQQILYVDGPVKVDLSGVLYVGQNSQIRLTQNGSLELHVRGSYVYFWSNGGVRRVKTLADNSLPNNPLPSACAIYLTGTSGAYLYGNPEYYGVVYSPNGPVYSNMSNDIYGSLVGTYVYLFNQGNLHFDEALRSFVPPGLASGQSISTWREIDNTGDASYVTFSYP